MPRILVVDDEEAIAELIGVYLRNEGFDVEMFGDGAQAAIRALDPHAAPIDLAILDVMLPGLDGLELCRRIRAEHAYPIIMLTAKGEQADRVAGLTFGADDYVVKPFLPLELVARVKAQLRRATIYNPAEAGDAAASSPASGPSLLVRGGLVLDISAHEATLNERPLPPHAHRVLHPPTATRSQRGRTLGTRAVLRGLWRGILRQGIGLYHRTHSTFT